MQLFSLALFVLSLSLSRWQVLKVSQSASLSVILFHCRLSLCFTVGSNKILFYWMNGRWASLPLLLFYSFCVCNLCYGESCKKTYRAEKKAARVNWSKWPKLLLKLQLENWRERKRERERHCITSCYGDFTFTCYCNFSLSLSLSLYCSWVISDDHFFVSIDFVLYDLSSMSCL